MSLFAAGLLRRVQQHTRPGDEYSILDEKTFPEGPTWCSIGSLAYQKGSAMNSRNTERNTERVEY
jgi:hypothetical protein